MPGWHEKTKALQREGKLQMVGIIEEQHGDRTRLFMQWKEMDWPLLHDPLNLLEVEAVPLTYLIDEHGIVRYERPTDEDLRVFLETDYPAPATSPKAADLVPAKDSAEHILLWDGPEALGRAIDGFASRVEQHPDDPRAHFRLGVAYRERYDSELRENGDFQRAVEQWGAALDLDPNQYIFRRRIQQYGPRLDKPYPFYDWVPEARKAIVARGEIPAALAVEPGGAEYASPVDHLTTEGANAEEPDPQGRIYRDEKPLILTETVVVPSVVAPGGSVRAHVVMRPDVRVKAHWNNEVEDLVLWVSAPPGFSVDRPLHRVALPPDPVSKETRRVEIEIQTPEGFTGERAIPAYALYYVCEDVDGTCLYRRQDVEIKLRAR